MRRAEARQQGRSPAPQGLVLAGLFIAVAAAQPPGRGGPVFNFEDHTGFTQIFDGKTLNGWDGAPDLWTVENGEIIGLSCPDKPAGTTFLIYKGSEPGDFELKMELKVERGNTGVQYRSTQAQPNMNFPGGRGRGGRGFSGRGPGGPGARGPQGPFAYCAGRDAAPGAAPVMPGGGAYTKWNVQGYQFDFGGAATGNLWEGGRFPNERGNLATAGQVVVAREGQPNELVGTTAPAADLTSLYKDGDWNQIQIIARGYTFIHVVNGRVFNVTVDENAAMHRAKGVIAIQMEGTPMRVSARNIWLKNLN